MLHVISALCAASNLHTIVPGPLEFVCWRQFAVQRGDCKNLKLHLSVRVLVVVVVVVLALSIIMWKEVHNAVLGHQVVLHIRLRLKALIGGPSPRRIACQK